MALNVNHSKLANLRTRKQKLYRLVGLEITRAIDIDSIPVEFDRKRIEAFQRKYLAEGSKSFPCQQFGLDGSNLNFSLRFQHSVSSPLPHVVGHLESGAKSLGGSAAVH